MTTKYQTYVVKFEGKAPPVTAGMNINGGSLCGVSFNDQLALNDDARQLIEGFMDTYFGHDNGEVTTLLNQVLEMI